LSQIEVLEVRQIYYNIGLYGSAAGSAGEGEDGLFEGYAKWRGGKVKEGWDIIKVSCGKEGGNVGGWRAGVDYAGICEMEGKRGIMRRVLEEVVEGCRGEGEGWKVRGEAERRQRASCAERKVTYF